MRATIRKSAEIFEKANLEAATVILNDPVNFPEGSGGRQWAELFMLRLKREQPAVGNGTA
jgi:hypothetical protein